MNWRLLDKYNIFNTESEKFQLFQNLTLMTVASNLGRYLAQDCFYSKSASRQYLSLIGKNFTNSKKIRYDGCESQEYNFSRSFVHEILSNEKDEKKYIFYLQAIFDLDCIKDRLKHVLFEALNSDISNSKYPINLLKDNAKYYFEFKQIEKYSPIRIATKPSHPLSDEFYKHVLDNVFYYYVSVEKLSSIYTGKDEEALRDLIVPYLNGSYEDASASGETFNKKGKTDIILKDLNGNNLFIAECKIWRGEIQFLNAIDQLIERYVTWRDTKTCILIFNTKNADFTTLINTVSNSLIKSKYYLSTLETSEDRTRILCCFKLNLNEDRQIQCEIQVFNFKE